MISMVYGAVHDVSLGKHIERKKYTYIYTRVPDANSHITYAYIHGCHVPLMKNDR